MRLPRGKIFRVFKFLRDIFASFFTPVFVTQINLV